MTFTTTAHNFIELLTRTTLLSAEESTNIAFEYRNDVGAWIKDNGGCEESLERAKNFIKTLCEKSTV